MTTAARITISAHSVRAALAEWHSIYAGHSEPQRAAAQIRVEVSTSSEYADQHAHFLFDLLRKHAEAST